jgi:hypothetical protein
MVVDKHSIEGWAVVMIKEVSVELKENTSSRMTKIIPSTDQATPASSTRAG